MEMQWNDPACIVPSNLSILPVLVYEIDQLIQDDSIVNDSTGFVFTRFHVAQRLILSGSYGQRGGTELVTYNK